MDVYLEIYRSYEYRLCILDEYKNRGRAHEAWIISSAKLSEKHPTNGHPVHLFTVAPSKLIVEHVLNFSYRPPRLFSVARVLFKNSCERPVVSILSWKIERPFRISTNESVLCPKCASWHSYCYQFRYSVLSNTAADTTFWVFARAQVTATNNPFKHWWKHWHLVVIKLPFYQQFP